MWRVRFSFLLLLFLSLFSPAWGQDSGDSAGDLQKLDLIFKRLRIELSILETSLNEQKQSASELQRLLLERERMLKELRIELTSLQSSLSESERHSKNLQIALRQAREQLTELESSLEKAKASLTAYSRKALRKQIVTGVVAAAGGFIIGTIVKR